MLGSRNGRAAAATFRRRTGGNPVGVQRVVTNLTRIALDTERCPTPFLAVVEAQPGASNQSLKKAFVQAVGKAVGEGASHAMFGQPA
jgi:hypothetical protein